MAGEGRGVVYLGCIPNWLSFLLVWRRGMLRLREPGVLPASLVGGGASWRARFEWLSFIAESPDLFGPTLPTPVSLHLHWSDSDCCLTGSTHPVASQTDSTSS